MSDLTEALNKIAEALESLAEGQSEQTKLLEEISAGIEALQEAMGVEDDGSPVSGEGIGGEGGGGGGSAAADAIERNALGGGAGKKLSISHGAVEGFAEGVKNAPEFAPFEMQIERGAETAAVDTAANAGGLAVGGVADFILPGSGPVFGKMARDLIKKQGEEELARAHQPEDRAFRTVEQEAAEFAYYGGGRVGEAGGLDKGYLSARLLQEKEANERVLQSQKDIEALRTSYTSAGQSFWHRHSGT